MSELPWILTVTLVFLGGVFELIGASAASHFAYVYSIIYALENIATIITNGRADKP